MVLKTWIFQATSQNWQRSSSHVATSFQPSDCFNLLPQACQESWLLPSCVEVSIDISNANEVVGNGKFRLCWKTGVGREAQNITCQKRNLILLESRSKNGQTPPSTPWISGCLAWCFCGRHPVFSLELVFDHLLNGHQTNFGPLCHSLRPSLGTFPIWWPHVNQLLLIHIYTPKRPPPDINPEIQVWYHCNIMIVPKMNHQLRPPACCSFDQSRRGKHSVAISLYWLANKGFP